MWKYFIFIDCFSIITATSPSWKGTVYGFLPVPSLIRRPQQQWQQQKQAVLFKSNRNRMWQKQRSCHRKSKRQMTNSRDILVNRITSKNENKIHLKGNNVQLVDDETSYKNFLMQQEQLQVYTLVRILVPAIMFALATFLVFPPIVHFLTDAIRNAYDGLQPPTYYGPATLNLILTDNSNQFIQNIHNFCGLLFSLLTAHTFSFLYKQQETLYTALFEEVSIIQSVLEQVALVSEGRPDFYRTLLICMQEYVEQDLQLAIEATVLPIKPLQEVDSFVHRLPHQTKKEQETYTFHHQYELLHLDDLPAQMISIRPMHDPLETILYLTSVGEPSAIYSTIRSLRQARSKRLAALQRKMPELQMFLLYIFGCMALCTFPVIATGAQTVGGEALINVQRVQLSIAAFAMGTVLGVINELRRPGIGSAYTIDYGALHNLLRGSKFELYSRLEKNQENHNQLNKLSEKDVLPLLSDSEISVVSTSQNKPLVGFNIKKGFLSRMLNKIRNK